MSVKLNQQEFLRRAKTQWGDRWDFSQSMYNGLYSKVTVQCGSHGYFQQTPSGIFSGRVGCKKCKPTTFTLEDFINKSVGIWGSKWSYPRAEYQNNRTKVTITCSEHGDFQQAPQDLWSGRVGCSGCQTRGRVAQQDFKTRALQIWGSRWDYSDTTYLGSGDPVTVICRDHGEFSQRASAHLNREVGCRRCSGLEPDTEAFVAQSQGVWGPLRWGYVPTVYKGSQEPTLFTCPTHGEFTQLPTNHLRGHVGCRPCSYFSESLPEGEIGEFLKAQGLEIQVGRRDLLGDSRQEVDIYIPSKMVAIEFNGVYYHSEKFKDPNYHFNKWKLARESGINLIQVWEDDWRLKSDIIKTHLTQVLGISTLKKVPGRKTYVDRVSHKEAKPFLDAYHIQGFVPASHYIALREKSTKEIVAIGTFRRDRGNYYLTRYATSCNVQGGHSKIISFFEKNHEYTDLITFADLTFGHGALYTRTGWVQDLTLGPDYTYLKNRERHHKFGFRLKRFKTDPTLVYYDGATEKDLARVNKLLRVYDAGKIRFIKSRPPILLRA